MTHKQPNEHFQAAQRQAEHLKHIVSYETKRQQQKGILRSLLAGLRGGKR